MRPLLLSAAALFCAQLALTTVAQAADHEFCRRYAGDAREQLERARQGRCWRFFNLQDGRWASSYDDHYRWCRGVDYRDADRERDIRRNELHRCGV